MNAEILEIYRNMLDSGNLQPEEKELMKKDLMQQKKEAEEKIDELYNKGANPIEDSAKLNPIEASLRDIDELLERLASELSQGFAKSEERAVKEEYEQEQEDNESEEEYDEEQGDEESEEEYEEEQGDEESEEEYEEEQEDEESEEEYDEPKQLLEVDIEIPQEPTEQYEKEARKAVAGRKDIGTIDGAILAGERSACDLMKKINPPKKKSSEQKQVQHDEDEKVR